MKDAGSTFLDEAIRTPEVMLGEFREKATMNVTVNYIGAYQRMFV